MTDNEKEMVATIKLSLLRAIVDLNEETIAMAIKAPKSEEPCEDCVSKQAIDQNIYDYAESNGLSYANMKNYILDVPPVTPTRKKGKWIEEPNCWLRCSCCNSHHPHTSIYAIRGSNYCPECGAEMESEE